MNNHKAKERLAAILKELQEKNGFKSAAELARHIGIPEQRFRGYTRGQNAAQEESISKIESFMGLREGELWDQLYADDKIQSASELIPLFKSLNGAEKKRFIQKAMELI